MPAACKNSRNLGRLLKRSPRTAARSMPKQLAHNPDIEILFNDNTPG